MTLLAQVADQAVGTTSEMIVFGVFAVLALGAALAVITMRNIVHGALMLVLNFLAVAGLYLTLQSAFLSIIQALVYAGAIMVLFLFVIMLLGVGRDDLLASNTTARTLAVVGGVLVAGVLIFAFVGPYTSSASICGQDGVVATSSQVPCRGFDDVYDADDQSGAAFLGRTLFTRYTFPFELSALLLTVATIGAVILARRRDLAPEDEDDADTDDLEGIDPRAGGLLAPDASDDADPELSVLSASDEPSDVDLLDEPTERED